MLEYKIDVERFDKQFSLEHRQAIVGFIQDAVAELSGDFAGYFQKLGEIFNRWEALPKSFHKLHDLFAPNIAVLDWLMATGVNRKATIADVPCGLGNLALYLRELGFQDVWCYDSWKQIEQERALKLMGLCGTQTCLVDLPTLNSKPIDIIVSVGLPWEWIDSDLAPIIAKAKYILLDTGYSPPSIDGFELIGYYPRLLNVFKRPALETQVHLGCGKRCIDGFTHIDMSDFPHIDYRCDVRSLPMLADNSVDIIYTSHLLEYFDRQEVGGVLKEWRRALKPEAKLRVAVPDWQALIEAYKRWQNLDLILGPLYGRWPVDGGIIYHKTVYDIGSLKRVLVENGFYDVERYEWRETIHKDYDDYSQAYLPHLWKDNGLLISLNVECRKG